MSTLTLHLGRPTLADRFFARSIATDVVLVTAGAALTAVASQLYIPIQPVPITLQTLAVILVGSTLGATRGALSMVLYLAVGMLGMPVFSEGASGTSVVFGATGGYIVGFIFAAALTGWLAQRDWDKKFLGAAVSMAAGTIMTFAVGLPWLAVSFNATLAETLEWGLYPFIIGGIVKSAIAAGLLPVTWKLANRIAARRD